MTANQIAYQRLLEDRRHHVAEEIQDAYRNQEQAKYWNSSIALDRDRLNETVRYNTEQIRLRSEELGELVRSNLAKEVENHRHNLAVEDISAKTLAETVRSNMSREAETKRSNLAREAEDVRHHQTTEGLNLIHEQFYQTMETRKQDHYEWSDKQHLSVSRAQVGVQQGQLALSRQQQAFYESTFVDASYDGMKGKLQFKDYANIKNQAIQFNDTLNYKYDSDPWARVMRGDSEYEWIGAFARDVIPILGSAALSYAFKKPVTLK